MLYLLKGEGTPFAVSTLCANFLFCILFFSIQPSLNALTWNSTSFLKLKVDVFEGSFSYNSIANRTYNILDSNPDNVYTASIENSNLNPFPAPYCVINLNGIEPITLVKGAGINNESSSTSTIKHEDFTLIIGEVEQGGSYEFTFKGKTNGSGTNHFYMWVDWNQNNNLNNPGEQYYLGSITNSTGEDGKVLTATITVPANAGEGNTRMRIRKQRNTNSPNACLTSGGSNGQAEDYTIKVKAASANCFPTTTTNPSTLFIENVAFLGSLTEDIHNSSGYGNGFQDFTTSVDKPKQVPGGGFNVFVKNNQSSIIKAWVDWNQDGNFQENAFELIYSTYDASTFTASTSFGVIVPIGTPPGIYRMRIRSGFQTFLGNTSSFNYTSCQVFDATNWGSTQKYGEAEDYLIEVIADCNAKITSVTDGQRCGAGIVNLSVTGINATSYNWYTTEFGGSPISGVTGATYSPNLSESTTYYVTAVNTCESTNRKPINARIDPIPTIEFNANTTEICGEGTKVSLSAYGDKEEITLLSEDFESELGNFTSKKLPGNTVGDFTKRTSSFKPTNTYVWKPAISSGEVGNGFAFVTSDLGSGSKANIALTLKKSVGQTIKTHELLNLKLTYRLYYSHYYTDKLHVEIATNATGTNWQTVKTYSTSIGEGTRFKQETIDLPEIFLNKDNIHIRFRYVSEWEDGFAIDDIRLFGDKPLETSFDWTGQNSDIFESDCETPYNSSNPSLEVCIKPSEEQIENSEMVIITAQALLSNGCSAEGIFEIPNNTKVWNPDSETEWTSNSWKPSNLEPTLDNCVIIKKTLQLPSNHNGFAKNITLKENGNLVINKNSSLSINDFIHNEKTVNDFIVKSGGSLVQINDAAENIGEITAEREFTLSPERQQYNYIISPVMEQTIKPIYQVGNPKVLQHSEAENWFSGAGVGLYEPGKGFAIKEASLATVPNSTVTAKLKGKPFNGLLNYQLSYTAGNPANTRGYNLVGNPYPSNLDIEQLYDNNNSNIETTFWFWDNRGNTEFEQQGSSYDGAHYAKYNALAGTGVGAGLKAEGVSGGFDTRIPTRYVRPGTAFMIQAKNAGTLHFNNQYRVAQNGPNSPEFFGKNNFESTDKDRFWLILRTPTNLEYMTAVVYLPNGVNEFAEDDTKTNGSSDDIYTLIGEEQVVIQGRAPFLKTDKVPLGVRLFDMGTYVISIYDKEGVFANGQNIYIRDKKLKTIYNLTQADYKFIEGAGEINDRFEIIYNPNSLTAENASDNASKILIEKKDGNIVVTSNEHKITQVEIFNLRGRSTFQKSQINNLEFKVPVNRFEKQIIVFVVETETGEVITKKFVNK